MTSSEIDSILHSFRIPRFRTILTELYYEFSLMITPTGTPFHPLHEVCGFFRAPSHITTTLRYHLFRKFLSCAREVLVFVPLFSLRVVTLQPLIKPFLRTIETDIDGLW